VPDRLQGCRHRLVRPKRLPSLFSAALLVAAVAGCALNAQGHREVSERLAEYELDKLATPGAYGSVPQRTAAAQSQPAEGTTQRLIEDNALLGLIAAALERNPDILAAIDTARGVASRIPQATSLMDPMLMTRTLPEPVNTAGGDNYFVLGVEQKLPVPEKLDRRGRMALAETRMAIEMIAQTRLRVIGDVKRAYFQLLAIDQSMSITRENQRLLRDLIEVARGQMIAGGRQQQDVLRAQVELSSLESQLVELRQRRDTTAALLNTILDRPLETSIPSPPEYDIRRLEPRLNELLSRAMDRNPELRRMKSQIERDEQAVVLARLEYWPDFTVGFEWMPMEPRPAFRPPVDPQTGMRPAYSRESEAGMDNWAIMFGFNVPVWFERIEAGIRQAREEVSASRRQYASAKNRIAYAVRDALTRIHSMRDIADLYATTIIPQAEQAYQVSREGYVAGNSDFQFVVDNWQKWLFFRVEYYRTLADLERSVADLEETVGVSIIEARPEAPAPTVEGSVANEVGG
jgi:cobalt-zinc-cadmium efflux system outer membrane protein